MRVSRLYVSQPLTVGQKIELDDDNAHYVRTVLRLTKDDKIILFDGSGGEFLSILLEVSRSGVRIRIERHQDRSVESPLIVFLGLGISRGDRMDLSVQKAVELGVNRITPLQTERCLVQLPEERKAQRLLHWQKIIQHAAEQSGRTLLPELLPVTDLHPWVGDQKGLKIFLDPYAETSLADLKPENRQVTLLTGPEGGFADHERSRAKSAGFIPVRLGSRILRTETASLAALSAVQMLWGDFGRAA
ncbi:MAG: 16S rRNA (uracil(1498)-N(3))-methyltransferase [Gammaproteobacteria bacterium]